MDNEIIEKALSRMKPRANGGKKIKKNTNVVSFYISPKQAHLVTLLDYVLEQDGLDSRSNFIRLLIEQVLISKGLIDEKTLEPLVEVETMPVKYGDVESGEVVDAPVPTQQEEEQRQQPEPEQEQPAPAL